jgi:hypothetical protein
MELKEEMFKETTYIFISIIILLLIIKKVIITRKILLPKSGQNICFMKKVKKNH